MSKCPWNSVKRNIVIIIIRTLLNSGAQKMDFSVPISDNGISVLTVVSCKMHLCRFLPCMLMLILITRLFFTFLNRKKNWLLLPPSPGAVLCSV